MSVSLQETVGEFKFGGNTIKANRAGEFTIELVHGGEWVFDLGEISKLNSILSEFVSITKGKHERTFWRTNGSKIIRLLIRDDSLSYIVFLSEGGTRDGYFWRSEIPELLNNIRILTSEGAPYGRPILMLNVIKESRQEELVTQQQIPLNNVNSNSPLVIEREFTRESTKTVTSEVSFGVGIDYYISVNLETHFGINREDKISERIMVRMEAEPGEHKIYTITWKEVWIIGHAEFDMGDRREKVRFRLKSGLEPNIKQEVLT